jgi:hypothetical protein
VKVKGTRVSMVPPEGFVESRRYSGFRKESARAGIIVKEFPVPGAYELTLRNFTEQSLAAEGKKLLSQREVEAAGSKGRLFRLSSTTASGPFSSWVLFLGDTSGLVRVQANWREEDTKTLEGPLEAALLSVRWDPQAEPTPGPELFTLKELRGLKEAQRIGSSVIYTRDGQPGPRMALPPDSPLFMVLPSPWGTSVGKDLAAANLDRLRDEAGVEKVTVKSSAPLTVAGLEGHELLAQAKSSSSGQDVTVYQVLLVDPDRYFILRGTVGNAGRAVYLEHFKAAVRAFQPVPPEPSQP